MYKINLHAHTMFSDGLNTPLRMALEAKEMGFSALVLTDHFYGDKFPEVSMTKEKWVLFKKACREAREIIPVITGLEVPFLGEEVLIFGGSTIKHILENGPPTKEDLVTFRGFKDTAVILCHPSHNYNEVAPFVDGYEHYNSGSDFFRDDRDLGALEGMVSWCNSDAHSAGSMDSGYNIVGTKITTESQLVKYIKRGKQPTHVVRGVRK